MHIRSLLPALPVLGLLAMAPGAGATTLTGSFAAWQAGVGSTPHATTVNTGLFDPFALSLPTTSSIPLSDGTTLTLSTPAQVTQPEDGFPYLLSDGSNPDLFIPVDANGNQVSTETVSFASSTSALGFELVPFSSSQNGPYTVSVQLANGQALSASLPGGNFNTGTTVPAFFGFYGGGVTSLTLSTSDPNGFAVGNFVDVPEPASLALLGSGVAVLGLARRARWLAGASRRAA